MTLHERIEEIFRDVLNDDGLVLADETTAAEVPGWDSLAHINTMFSIEETFGIQFAGDEFARLRTIGELKETLRTKGVSA